MKYRLLVLVMFTSFLLQAQFKTKAMNENLQEEDFKKFGWGFWLAGNSFAYHLEPEINFGTEGIDYQPVVDDEAGSGFSVGLMGRARLAKYLDLVLEPGMHFVSRRIFFTNSFLIDEEDRQRTVQSTYFAIPISLKYNGVRWGNTRPYVKAGVGYFYNVQSKETVVEDNADGVFRTTSHNFNWQAELGIDIYFKRFKMSPFLQGLFFINNELVEDNPSTIPYWAGAIEDLRTEAFIFGLRFQ